MWGGRGSGEGERKEKRRSASARRATRSESATILAGHAPAWKRKKQKNVCGEMFFQDWRLLLVTSAIHVLPKRQEGGKIRNAPRITETQCSNNSERRRRRKRQLVLLLPSPSNDSSSFHFYCIRAFHSSEFCTGMIGVWGL